jgi:hypothetical protein
MAATTQNRSQGWMHTSAMAMAEEEVHGFLEVPQIVFSFSQIETFEMYMLSSCRNKRGCFYPLAESICWVFVSDREVEYSMRLYFDSKPLNAFVSTLFKEEEDGNVWLGPPTWTIPWYFEQLKQAVSDSLFYYHSIKRVGKNRCGINLLGRMHTGPILISTGSSGLCFFIFSFRASIAACS